MAQKNSYDHTEGDLCVQAPENVLPCGRGGSEYFYWGDTWLKVFLKDLSDCV